MSLAEYERAGSSPRVRGKPCASAFAHGVGGLIPACAGKTTLRRECFRRRWAHPRVCGENVSRRRAIWFLRGSSPRVRGKHGDAAGDSQPLRLIPACAGKTRLGRQVRCLFRAHPRVCGENIISMQAFRQRAGSSPRVRGKPSDDVGDVRLRGLIPACAGKTPPGGASWPPARAHPRVCGENYLFVTTVRPSRGSSPRVRGKPPVDAVGVGDARLIPACAGKTKRPRPGPCLSRAHPRVCGENTSTSGAGRRPCGSSPRVRGKQ